MPCGGAVTGTDQSNFFSTAGSTEVVRVACPDDMSVVGGGCADESPARSDRLSLPEWGNGRNGWECGGLTGKRKTAYAICSPDLKVLHLGPKVGSDWSPLRCPADLSVLGGGCWARTGFEYAAPSDVRTFLCGGGGAEKTSRAICTARTSIERVDQAGAGTVCAACSEGHMVAGGGCRGHGSEPKSSYPDETQRAWCCAAHGSEALRAWANCVNDQPPLKNQPKGWEGCWSGGSSFYGGAVSKLSACRRKTSEPLTPASATRSLLARPFADPPKWEIVQGQPPASKLALSYDSTSVSLIETSLRDGRVYTSQFDEDILATTTTTMIRLVNANRKWTFTRTACPSSG